MGYYDLSLLSHGFVSSLSGTQGVVLFTLNDLLELDPAVRRSRGLVSTPREIAQQPSTWKTTLQLFRKEQTRVQGFLESAGVRSSLDQRPVVVLIGAGTSDYIGMALVALLRRTWGCEVFACASTTLLTNMEDYVVPGRRYLWISFSRSGDSPEGVAVLEQACERHPEITHLVVTCNAEAAMIRACGSGRERYVIVLDDAVNDKSLVMTSSFTNMIILGQCLAHAWSLEEYESLLDELARDAERLLETAAILAAQCETLSPKRICFIGSGPLEAVAKESALKVLEMTAGGIKTMSETVLGLRHGPMAALDKETLLVCFVSEDEKAALYARDLVLEAKQKEVTLSQVAVGPHGALVPADLHLAVSGLVPDLYRPVLDVIFGQMLGLYCSLALGLEPDAPSPGGVIRRVVHGVTIY